MKILKSLIILGLYNSFVNTKNLKSIRCSSSLPEVCGPFASCVEEDLFGESNELSYCECDSFAYGEPPNCKSKCKDTCKSNEYCDIIQKVCITKCENHEHCKIDEYCRLFNGDCRKGCRDHNSCKNNEFCDFQEKKCKIGCRGDEFCNADEYCDFFKNICIKGCRDDDSCKDDEYCDTFNTRLCHKGCREWPGNCKKGYFCNSDNHECEEGCEHDIHCESNEICNLNDKKCYSHCYESPCGNNSVCTIVENNRHCSCKAGYSPISGIGCKRNRGDTTSSSSETLDCQKHCGNESMCAIENNKITCYCSEDNDNNPFIDCSFIPPVQPAPIGPGCIASLCG
ncbi:WAP four-disulfide core domain protein 3-like [Chironomus tepperi]|uniref:WAP four-disulfide core domain protein 3-like n=1 Tax=Chironomus tepperi TaxID=113505 RepID=UPI00391FB421